MIDASMIPDEVVEAAAIDLFRSATAGPAGYSWATTHERTRAKWRKNARVTIAAALNAWEGANQQNAWSDEAGELLLGPHLILPLPKEGE
jgi:hypothetical protein